MPFESENFVEQLTLKNIRNNIPMQAYENYSNDINRVNFEKIINLVNYLKIHDKCELVLFTNDFYQIPYFR